MKKFQALFVLFFLTAGSSILQAKKVPSVQLSADTLFFSPNKDGASDSVTFETKAENVKSLASWELKIQDAAGVAKKSFSGTKRVPASLLWDGVDDFGAPCAEGSYDVSFKVWNEKSQVFTATPLRVILDLTPPTISLSCSMKTVPMKDHVMTPVTFYFSGVDLSGISEWRLELQDKSRLTFFSESSTGPLPSSWVWKGENAMPGKVTAILYVTDKAANRGSSPPVELEVQEQSPAKMQEPSAAEPAAGGTAAQNKSAEGPFLQLTSIISIADLFGKDADNQSSLTPESSVLLDPLAKALLDSPGSRAIILGHVDAKSSAKEAKALSSYFGWRVFSYFVKQKGCDKSSISVKGLGSDVPIADNRTLLGRSRNRRIEIQMFFPASAAK